MTGNKWMPDGYPSSWDMPYIPPPNVSEELRDALDAAYKRLRNMTPEQKRAEYEAQRESWVRAMGPCEHGDYDWETCPDCLTKYAPPPGDNQ